ncbi:hypothetical protein STEG23_033267, partial [Scotinomys teguina]
MRKQRLPMRSDTAFCHRDSPAPPPHSLPHSPDPLSITDCHVAKSYKQIIHVVDDVCIRALDSYGINGLSYKFLAESG